jgi:VRR-NUC domain
MMTETQLLAAIRKACGREPGLVLWRNNVGTARYSSARGATQVRYGLIAGAADLIGIVTTSSGLGRFIALEVKAPRGRLRPAQRQFLELVTGLGGFAAVVRSVDDAVDSVRLARQLR